jgi:hypothetical protein
MKYPVTIFGAKVHPEEFYITPSGQLIVPYANNGVGLGLVALVAMRTDDASGRSVPILPPVESVKTRLVDGYLPAVENEWKIGDLKMKQLAFATLGGKFESLTAKEPLIAMVRYTLTNESAASREAVLAIQLYATARGQSVKAVPPANPNEFSFDSPLLKQKDGAIVACLLTKDINASFQPLTPANEDKKNPEGNRLTLNLPLAAGESKTVELAIPYFPLAGEAGQKLADLRVDGELAVFREYWARELDRNAQFIVPEKMIRDAYRTCLANNLLLIDRDPNTGVLMPHPDALEYEAVWAGDGSVSIQAMDRMGFHDESAKMLEYFLARHGRDVPEGDVSSAEGFFSGDVGLKWMNQNGFVLWAMSEHYKLTRDDAWLKKVAQPMMKGCDWIDRERARTKTMENGRKVKHYGLLPKGRPSDLYIHDNWYWTDTYSYMGLRGTADVLAQIGMKDEAAKLATEADDYKACILDSIDRSLDPNVKPTFVPPSPYRAGPPTPQFFYENWYSICSPIYMVEAGLLDAKSPKIDGTCYWLEKYGLFTGLPSFGDQLIDPYYGYSLSLAQLLRGEADKFDWTLYSVNAYAMGQGTYATIEGHNLITGFNAETWDANRQPHMHSNSRYIDWVRIALLLEDGDALHLMAGTPRGWLADGQTIEAKRAPSYFGEVNFTARSSIASGKISVEIEPTAWKKPNVILYVRPPVGAGKIKSVTVNGKDWKDFDGECVRIPKLDAKIVVNCFF